MGLDLPSGVSVVPLLLGFSARGFSGCVQGFFMVPLWSARPPSHRPRVTVILWPREAMSVSPALCHRAPGPTGRDCPAFCP